MKKLRYAVNPPIDNEELNSLFLAGRSDHLTRDYKALLAHSLLYVFAYDDSELVGFVNVAWDGGDHGFILDPTVRPSYRRRGIGTNLLREATKAAAKTGIEWLHVDYVAELTPFYEGAGFKHTEAGLIRIDPNRVT